MRSWISRAAIAGVAALTVVVAMAIPAGATISSPGNNASVSGTFTISATGTAPSGASCAAAQFVGSDLDYTTVFLENSGGGVLFSYQGNHGSGTQGASTTYESELQPNGSYRVAAQEVYYHSSGFLGLGCSQATNNYSENITIANQGSLSYTGATSAEAGTSASVSAKLVDQSGIAPPAGQTVSFTLSGGSTVSAQTNSSGVASTTLPVNGPPRSTSVTVSYGGSYYTATSIAPSFTVTQDPTTTTLGTASTDYGQTATFTAAVASQVAGQPTPTGSVQFSEDGHAVGSPQPLNGSAVATYQDASLAAGSHTIGAVYLGSSYYLSSTASNATQIVNVAPTKTTVASQVQPSSFGQAVTYVATVTATSPGPDTGFPTGTVSFSAVPNGGGAAIAIGGAVTLASSGTNSSTAQSTPISLLNAGSYTVTATYSPTANFGASASNTQQTVSPANTGVSVTSTLPTFSDFGQAVQFTAVVTTQAPGQGSPTGSVTFVADAGGPHPITIGTATLQANGANTSAATSPAIASLSPGLHVITATYTNSDGNFVTGTSGQVDQFVAPDPSTTVVSTVNDTNPSVFGQPVQFQATVTLAFTDAGTPTGVVLFFINSTNSAPDCASPPAPAFTETLVNGVATTPADSSLPVGNNYVSACYASTNPDFAASGTTDPQYDQVVNPDPTTTTLSSANSPGGDSGPSVFGQPVTFTASVTANPPGGGIPLGTVTFLDGTNPLGTEPLSGGASSDTATFMTSGLAVGNHAIEAVYNPSNDDYLSSNGAVNHIVNPDPTTTTVAQNQPSVQGQAVTFTATVTANAPGAGVPTGTIEFEVNGADIFGGPVALTPGTPSSGSTATSPPISNLTPGTYQVTAVYSGDTDFLASSGTASQQVGESGTTTSLAISPSAASVTFGTPVSLTATVVPTGSGFGLPTGSVDFYDGLTLLGSAPLTTVGGVQQATLPATDYSVGNHSFGAVYLGEADFIGSTSSSVAQSVTVISTTTSLQTSGSPSLYSVPVTFTATVTPSSNAGPGPGGTVTFSDGGTTLATVPVTAASGHYTASFTDSALAVGTHSVSASYSGSSDYGSSASSAVSQVVNKDGTVITAQPLNNSTMTATLTSAQGAPIGGQTLSFSSNGAALCTAVTNAQGVASCTATGLQAIALALNGKYTVTYAGNGSYLPSTVTRNNT